MLTPEDLNAIRQLIQEATTYKEYYSVEEAAHYLGIAKSTLYKKTSLGNISFYKPNGKLITFKKDDLDKWIEQHRIPSNEELINEEFISHNKNFSHEAKRS